MDYDIIIIGAGPAGYVAAIVYEQLSTFFAENPKEAKLILEKVVDASRARIAARNHAFVPVQTEPVQVFHDLLDRILLMPRPVGILNPKEERAPTFFRQCVTK
jgi:hypothetical protein